jgi:outer membrane protein TolC
MEVDLRRVDESDSKWSFIPNISLQTTVYLYGPTQQPDTRGYSIDFVTNQYNPLESYFSLRAKEILTNIARYSHMQAISVGIHRLAQTILDLDQREQLSARQEEMIGLARQKLDYVRRIQRMGSATLLDVKGVETQLQALQAEGEALNMARASALEELKLHLGFPAEQRLSIDFPQARRQLLAGFEPQNATLDQALERSFELKILRLREGVQDYQITQAYGKYMPTFFFGVRTPDPLNTTTKQEYFFFVGANLPVWDGMQRANNVTRQKIILRQYQLDTVAKRTDLASRWRVVQDQLRNALAAVKVAQSAEELAALHVEQREIRYKANGQPLSLLLDDKMARAEAQKRLISRRLEQDQAALNVRHTCGDLFTTFVNPLPSQD